VHFYGKTKICYGKYALDTLEEVSCTHAFVVTDPFMVKSGFAAQVTSHLERRDIPVEIFSDVEPDPSLETVKRGALAYAASKADLVVALGGGSAIDTAKAIIYFACKAADDLPRPVLAAIPTTSGTGSEVTSISVVTDKQNSVKIPLNDDMLIPDVAILDARFTRTVPPSVTAATGMDVLTHAIEAYTSRNHNAFTDILAVEGTRYVFSALLRAYQNMEDMQAALARHDATLDEHERRIHALEKGQDAIQQLTLDVAKISAKMDFLAEKMDKLDSKVEALEQKPAKRWDGLVTALITALAGALIGWLMDGRI
jgi:alcohol dehydrogenase class IV